MGRALLVIDMQNVCVGKEHADFFKYDRDNLITLVNRRIAKYESDHVFYICQITKRNFISRFAPVQAFLGSYEAAVAEEIDVVSDHIILKYKGDAFTNPDFYKMLKERNIDEVEIIGVDGGGCVALTALGALEHNFRVIMNEQAIGTMFTKRADKYKSILKERGAETVSFST